MRSAIVLIAVFAVCLGSPRRPVPRHPNAELINGALQRTGDSRIINGEAAEIENHPWQASLRFNGGHTCGASIISDQWLVSAAHCTHNRTKTSFTVGVGNKHLSVQTSEGLKPVDQIIEHEAYNSGTGSFPNDICLIKLREPLDLKGASVRNITLADADKDADTYTDCSISGWGLTTTGGGGAVSSTLQAASTKIMSRSTCRGRWGESSINDGHVCVGGTFNEGSCNGDSGGPLSCKVNGISRLVGATSWGINGCHTFFPSVYTNIPYFREWIRQNSGI